MKIAINGYEAVVPRFGFDKNGLPIRVGSGVYCYELLVQLSKIDKKNNYLIYLPRSPVKDMPEENENWKYRIIPAKKAWTLTSLSLELLKTRSSIDVFFSPTHYLPLTSPSKSVISILDVSYLHFPKLFRAKDLYQLKVWGGYSIRKASKILTISESSKSDIIKEYNISPDKVIVTYPGIKQVSSSKYKVLNMDDLRKKFGIEGEFILFVGTLQPRKNIVRLIEAFSKIARGPATRSAPERTRSRFTDIRAVGNPSTPVTPRLNPLQLVIVGKKGWQYDEILRAPEKFGVKDQVLFIEDAKDEDLAPLYQNALMFVLPSLYEGFGLPILEAMNYGCAVITSNVSSLPEAGRDAALYVDPKDVEDISKKMQKLIEDESLRKGLIEKGYQQVKKFSWEKSARETLKVLEEVVKA